MLECVRALLVMLFAGGCTLRGANRAALAASTAALACDWLQTRHAAEMDWRYGIENNPILGPAPHTSVVDGHFASAAVFNAIIWVVMPERWKWAVPTVITTAQVRTVANNVEHGQTNGLCGSGAYD